MSGPTSSASNAPGSKDDGISKYMKRMKTVLKSGTRSNRASVSSMAEIMGDSGKSGTTTTKAAGGPSSRYVQQNTFSQLIYFLLVFV